MVKKLTITVDEDVYDGLHLRIGAGKISRFINDLARPYVANDALAESYRQMAADELYEKEAAEWVSALEGETWPHGD
jgi:hypothetical protein